MTDYESQVRGMIGLVKMARKHLYDKGLADRGECVDYLTMALMHCCQAVALQNDNMLLHDYKHKIRAAIRAVALSEPSGLILVNLPEWGHCIACEGDGYIKGVINIPCHVCKGKWRNQVR